MDVTVQELFNQLCAAGKIRLQVQEGEGPNLHSRLCRIRASEDKLFSAIGQSNPMLPENSQISSKILQHTHLEDGTKMCIVEFSITTKQTRRFTLLPIDSESEDDSTG